jgi:hypothetical protein
LGALPDQAALKFHKRPKHAKDQPLKKQVRHCIQFEWSLSTRPSVWSAFGYGLKRGNFPRSSTAGVRAGERADSGHSLDRRQTAAFGPT